MPTLPNNLSLLWLIVFRFLPKVKVWRLTPTGLQFDVSQCWRDLQGHSKRILLIEWHPTAKSVLLSAGADLKVRLAVDDSGCSKNSEIGDHMDTSKF